MQGDSAETVPTNDSALSSPQISSRRKQANPQQLLNSPPNNVEGSEARELNGEDLVENEDKNVIALDGEW